MVTVSVPYHLDEELPGFGAGVPVDHVVRAPDPAPQGSPWTRMAVLYERVASIVAQQRDPCVVVSGDCTTSLGVLAGLQRRHGEVGVVWFDAHADFHTADTTTSGYLGGMPLALAVGLGTPTLPTALDLRPVPEAAVVLVDARDTDPGEHALLERSRVVRTSVADLDAATVPAGPVYLHVDVDVCDPEQVPGLLYPAPGGPSAEAVVAAVERVAATGRVAALGLAATWRHDSEVDRHEQLIGRLVRAAAR